MPDDPPPFDTFRPAPAVHTAASLFRIVSSPIRLQVLIALSMAGERNARQLSRGLGGLEPALIYRNLAELYSSSFISRRLIGGQYAFAVAREGRAVIDAFDAICRQMSDSPPNFPATPDASTIGAPLEPPAAGASPVGAPKPCPKLFEVATLLNHGSNPVRHRILLMLAESEQDAGQLYAGLGDVTRSTVGHHLEVLCKGGFLTTGRPGLAHVRRLTQAGVGLVDLIRATSSLASSDAIDGATPGGVAHLFGAFADPVRLRILNLLAGTDGVCFCHIHGVLDMPRKTLRLVLDGIKGTGLIIERSDSNWEYYCPTSPANILYRALTDQLGSYLSDFDLFEGDRQRLRGLATCSDQKKSKPREAAPRPLDRHRAEGQCGGSGPPPAGL